MRRLAELEDMSTAELKARWKELYGQEPPRFNRGFLLRRLAYRIQELAYGGLPGETVKRLFKELADDGYDGMGVKAKRGRRKAQMKVIPGTVFVREWNGERHEVTVLDGGFAYRGVPYRSLSAVAREITGTRWNGPAFFGLRGGNGKNIHVRESDG